MCWWILLFGITTFPLDPSAWWLSWHRAGQRGWSLGPGTGALPPHRLCADSSRLGCPTWWMHWLHLSGLWQFRHHSSVASVFFEMQHGAQTPLRYNLDSKKSWRGLLMQKYARDAVTALLSRVFFSEHSSNSPLSVLTNEIYKKHMRFIVLYFFCNLFFCSF